MLLSDPDDDEPTQAIVMDTSSPAVAAGSDDEDKQGDEPTQAWNRSAGQEEGEVDDDDGRCMYCYDSLCQLSHPCDVCACSDDTSEV